MIKNIIKILIKWFYNFFNSLQSLLKIGLFSSFMPTYKKDIKSSDKHCYILGNGPSLKETTNKKNDWKNEKDVFVVNDFVLSDQFEIIQPTYYVLVDPGYWVTKTFPEMIQLRNKVFQFLNEKTTWEITLFISKQAYQTGIFQNKINNKFIQIKFFNTTEVKGFSRFEFFCYAYNLGMPVLQNVMVAAIYLAINLQYKEINILGAEHSWLKTIMVNNQNKVCQINDHFYDKEEVAANVWLKFSGEPYLLHEVLIDLSKMFFAYHKLNDYALHKSTKIYNLTKGSYIDAFEKKQDLNK